MNTSSEEHLPADVVNHPPHYTAHPSGVECIQITEHMGFCVGNAVKYLWRADHKGNAVEDLQKARWYIDREIRRRTEEPTRCGTFPKETTPDQNTNIPSFPEETIAAQLFAHPRHDSRRVIFKVSVYDVLTILNAYIGCEDMEALEYFDDVSRDVLLVKAWGSACPETAEGQPFPVIDAPMPPVTFDLVERSIYAKGEDYARGVYGSDATMDEIEGWDTDVVSMVDVFTSTAKKQTDRTDAIVYRASKTATLLATMLQGQLAVLLSRMEKAHIDRIKTAFPKETTDRSRMI